VEQVKKHDAGHNKPSAKGPVVSASKLDNETEVFSHEHVSSELKKQIQQARIAKKLTQAQVRRSPRRPPAPLLAGRASAACLPAAIERRMCPAALCAAVERRMCPVALCAAAASPADQ
jgi:hypothetical protein